MYSLYLKNFLMLFEQTSLGFSFLFNFFNIENSRKSLELDETALN